MIDISYGVLHFNPKGNLAARGAFEDCLRSLSYNRNQQFNSEVFVIDQGNCSNERDFAFQEAVSWGFRFISLPKNVGISRGINMLFNLARGSYISLVTSDTQFTKGLDTGLVNTLERNSDIWQICPVSDNSEIEQQRASYRSNDITKLIAQELTIQFWDRKVIDRVGYFDERWKACYENLDYALRIYLAGGYPAIHHEFFCPHIHGMCIKSGARNSTYDNYIDMPDGFNQEMLVPLWNQKWPSLDRYLNIYDPLDAKITLKQYDQNIYCPYIQDVGY